MSQFPSLAETSTVMASVTVVGDLAAAEMEAEGAERSEPADSEQEDEEDVYEVEQIIDMKMEKDEILYRVRWKGYSAEDDTWEPEAHLEDCREVLLEFRRKAMENKLKQAKKENQKLTLNSEIFEAESDSDFQAETKESPPIKKKKKIKLEQEEDSVQDVPKKEKSKSGKTKEKSKSDLEEQGGLNEMGSVKGKDLKAKKRASEPTDGLKDKKKQKTEDSKDKKIKGESNEGKKKQRDDPKEGKKKKKSKLRLETDPSAKDNDVPQLSSDWTESHTDLKEEKDDGQAVEDTVEQDVSGKVVLPVQQSDGTASTEDVNAELKVKKKKKKNKNLEGSEQETKSHKAKDGHLEKKSVEKETIGRDKKQKQEKIRLSSESDREAPAKMQKSSKANLDERGGRPTDTTGEDSAMKKSSKNKRTDCPTKFLGKSNEQTSQKPEPNTGTKEKNAFHSFKKESKGKEKATEASLFDKLCMDSSCNKGGTTVKEQSGSMLETKLETVIEEGKAPFKDKIGKKSDTTREVAEKRPDSEKEEKGRREQKAASNTKEMKGLFDVFQIHPEEANDGSKNREKKTEETSKDLKLTEENKFRENRLLHKERKSAKDENETKAYGAAEGNHEVLDTVCQTEENSDGRQVLNLGMDLQLEWMTLEDFQKHLDGEDEIISTTESISNSVLRDAVKNGDYLTVKLALNSKEEYNLDQENFLTTVAILLEAGVHVNLQQISGETALMKACKRGNSDIVRLLLEYGADCNILSKHQNSALHYAKQSNNILVYDLLKNHIEVLSRVAEDTIRDYFEARLALLEPVFPVACHRLCEGPDFSLDFNYKPPHNTAEGSGILLFIFHANFFGGSEIIARLCGPCSVQAVVLNDKFQLPVFLDSHFIYSFSPVPGLNKLFIRLTEALTAKVKLLICAYQVQLQ
ncbi:M-phase phosphoprotein 8 isoform X2 [Latimeria chalumnae]|uniref:M-phase phosphoprotein 8 isoform X2 n=1 Tax=Latimeria chalumnae TaxID=7897 RepID=UPI0003C16E32|nr:PREDICTED: M-phase phosphoprotein 8 isoform X2 [Latimeria chalumnae]|eukprot:XP_006006743.1 PREDICTED: M-phase phosphoprotein 8 isoform X2 [Latimeria chalumnae]